MVQINFAQKQINAKIVYYGPGMSGKTTNLEVVHKRAPETNRGDLTSISTDGDRTLFFDYMPLDLGTIAGMKTSFQMYTVPGQVYYNSTRKLVLQGVDGVIFVADSSPGAMEANLESLRNLEENLAEYGKSLATMPHVIQFNKRDIPGAMTVEEMSAQLNPHGAPVLEAVAATGQGVFPTLKGLASLVLKHIQSECSSGPRASLTQTGFHAAPRAVAKSPAAPQAEPVSSETRPAGGGLDLAARSDQQRQAPQRAVEAEPAMASVDGGPSPRGGKASPYGQSAPKAEAPRAQAQGEPAQSQQAVAEKPKTYTPAGTSAAQLMRQQSAARSKAQPAPAASAPQARSGMRRTTAQQVRQQPAAAATGGAKGNLFIVMAAAIGAGVAALVLRFI